MVPPDNIESLLAIDIGAVNTRAFLFSITEGMYRYLATGVVPTTYGAAFNNNLGIGISQAIERLQEITGRVFIGKEGGLAIPTQADGTGVDALVTTLSVGPAIKTVVVGLLADVSLESAQRLAASCYTQVAGTIGLSDRRSTEMQIETIIRAQPDLVIISGGTDGGASRSVMKLVDTVGLACQLLPDSSRPPVVFSGNQSLTEQVKVRLEPVTSTLITSNIRPSISLEDLSQAQEVMNETVTSLRMHQFSGLQDFVSKNPLLSAFCFGRIIRFLSQAYDPAKGVLGIDLGASSTVVASGQAGILAMDVLVSLGMGDGMTGLQSQAKLAEIAQWMPVAVTDEAISNYIYNKPLNPGSIPVTLEDLAIEQAAARVILHSAIREASNRFPTLGYNPSVGLISQYEPILASGSILTQAPTQGQALLMLLDGLQPTGITTVVLDQNNLATVLGAAGSITSLLPVQVLESGAFLNLGTVISPVSTAKSGSTILKIHTTLPDGEENRYEIKQGTLTVLPIQNGQRARLSIEVSHDTNIGMKRPGVGGSINVVGGSLGTVIDARGRPIVLPNDITRRRELVRKWLWTLGG
jgi:hypothetical protein